MATIDVLGQRAALPQGILRSHVLVWKFRKIGPSTTENLVFRWPLPTTSVRRRKKISGWKQPVIALQTGLQSSIKWFPFSSYLSWTQGELFFAWKYYFYNHQPHDKLSLLDTADAGFRNISAEGFQVDKAFQAFRFKMHSKRRHNMWGEWEECGQILR